MKRHYLGIIALGALGLQNVYAENIKANENDTIKTYNMGEVIVPSSTKETNNLRTLPGSKTSLSPQMISGRQIDALKDISSFVPNLYMPDYGAKLTSAIYIRGIGARSSGQSVGLYVDNVPYLDKSTFDFELTDIQRIEVLRGPQGTLYGRNAMGCIVYIYTLSPFDYQGTKVTMSMGNYGAAKAKVSQYSKIGENIGISLNGYYDRNAGFFINDYNGTKADKEDALRNMELLDLLPLKKRCYRDLSGGQQQRVLLARALCATKKLLLLDEPVTGLDPVMTNEMYQLIRRINREQNVTIIMVSHDIRNILPDATHILQLDQKQVFFGPMDEYLKTEAGKQFLGGAAL